MIEPIDYRVVRNLQAAIAGIARSAGYYYDLVDSAVRLDPEQDIEPLIDPSGPRPFVVIDVQPEEWRYDQADQILLTLPISLHWYYEARGEADSVIGTPEPTRDEQRMQLYFRGCADLEKAIAADTGRGGLATDTRIIKRTFVPDVPSQEVHAQIDIEVRVYRTYGRPAGA